TGGGCCTVHRPPAAAGCGSRRGHTVCAPPARRPRTPFPATITDGDAMPRSRSSRSSRRRSRRTRRSRRSRRVWGALYGGSSVRRYAPDGALDEVVELPVTKVTACAFGGPGLDRLFISTSREQLESGAEPETGALFGSVPGMRGVPVREFAG